MSIMLSLGVALFMVLLVPFVPKLLRLRIRFLRWIHWNRLANHMESHFRGWTLFIRATMLSVAIVSLLLANW